MKIKEITIAEYSTHEIIIEKSRFITHLFPTDSAEAAKDFIQKIKKEHHDATHNCSAYIINHETLIQKANDDGEPSGTAGMPMLNALIQRNMVNMTTVVTRYFGGIKLGAGGLIRAYSSAVTTALDQITLYTYTTFSKLSFAISYDELNTIYHLQETTKHFIIDSTEYDTNILMTITVEQDKIELLEKRFTENLLRQIQFKQLGNEIRKTPLT